MFGNVKKMTYLCKSLRVLWKYGCNSVGRMLHLGCSCRWFESNHPYYVNRKTVSWEISKRKFFQVVLWHVGQNII